MGKLFIFEPRSGHREVTWDSDAAEAVHEAERIFKAKLAEGRLAFRMAPDNSGDRITAFDPEAEEILIIAPMMGGAPGDAMTEPGAPLVTIAACAACGLPVVAQLEQASAYARIREVMPAAVAEVYHPHCHCALEPPARAADLQPAIAEYLESAAARSDWDSDRQPSAEERHFELLCRALEEKYPILRRRS